MQRYLSPRSLWKNSKITPFYAAFSIRNHKHPHKPQLPTCWHSEFAVSTGGKQASGFRVQGSAPLPRLLKKGDVIPNRRRRRGTCFRWRYCQQPTLPKLQLAPETSR